MAKQTEIETKLIIIYPDGKIFKRANYDEHQNHVAVHYQPLHNAEIAQGMVGDPNLFIVPHSVVSGRGN